MCGRRANHPLCAGIFGVLLALAAISAVMSSWARELDPRWSERPPEDAFRRFTGREVPPGATPLAAAGHGGGIGDPLIAVKLRVAPAAVPALVSGLERFTPADDALDSWTYSREFAPFVGPVRRLRAGEWYRSPRAPYNVTRILVLDRQQGMAYVFYWAI